MIAIKPSANVRFPAQSIFACRRAPGTSRSFRYDQTVPKTPNGTETMKTSRHSIGASSPADHEADEHPADPDDVRDPEREPALVGRERVGEDRSAVREQEGGADPLQDPPARSASRRRPGPCIQSIDSAREAAEKIMKPSVYIRTRP